MLRLAVRSAAPCARLKIDVKAELCGNDDLVADWLQRLTYKFLICERTIGLGRIEHGHAAVMGSTDQFDHLDLVGGRPIESAHAHASEAESRYFEIAFAKSSFLHGYSSSDNKVDSGGDQPGTLSQRFTMAWRRSG